VAIPLQAPYLVTTDRDKTLAELRQRLAELLDIRRDVEQALGVHALIDQTVTALDRATALYADAQSSLKLGDISGARRCKGQAEIALLSASGYLRAIDGEDYDGG
jgi:hypothetical protein